VGLAQIDGGQCSPHAQGFRRHPLHGAGTLRCRHCHQFIVKGAWYRMTERGPRHLRDCETPRKATTTGKAQRTL
jgi:hypothetical protein